MGKGLILAAAGALAYLTRANWLPQIESSLGIPASPPTASGATGNSPTLPTQSTANQPITAAIPGALAIGTDGCYSYSNGTAGTTVINCPPGVSPPVTQQANSCAAGFTLDAGGICTRYPDAYLLANLNTVPWTGLSDIPPEQIARIDPQILSMYSTTTGVNAGTALAYLLGLGGSPADGTIGNGSDGNAYKALGNVWYRQGTSTMTTTPNPTVAVTYDVDTAAPTQQTISMQGIGGRMGSLPSLSAALPITPATLILASSDPKIAALVGRDPRAMLTAQQWDYYYTQATGIVQGIPLHPADDRQALMSAAQYQARRLAAGLQTTNKLGLIRNARRGAFPLGAINQWVPPGNRTIYQIPGRGAVPAGRGGAVPTAHSRMGLIQDGGGNHRWARSPFPRPAWWREAE